MMDCGDDEDGLEDFVELATDIADSSRTIRDAAERLLTLLGVADDDEDLLSFSSEDEGVEVDVDVDDDVDDEDEDEDGDDNELENTRLLHQLAASLAQELKYSQQSYDIDPPITTVTTRLSFKERLPSSYSSFDYSRTSNQKMEMTNEEISRTKNIAKQHGNKRKASWNLRSPFMSKEAPSPKNWSIVYPERRLRLEDDLRIAREENEVEVKHESDQIVVSSETWGSGWDACATEALRYLVEEEGLPPHHPTVIAMKNHLTSQRKRVFAQHTA